jgi:hypothetical protein
MPPPQSAFSCRRRAPTFPAVTCHPASPHPPAQSPISSHGILEDSRPSRRLPGAAVRVQMPEVQSPHRKNRTRERSASQKMPALRRQSRIAHLCARHPIQRFRLVRHRLRRQISRRRKRQRRKILLRQKRFQRLQGFFGQRLLIQRILDKRLKKRKARQKVAGFIPSGHPQLVRLVTLSEAKDLTVSPIAAASVRPQKKCRGAARCAPSPQSPIAKPHQPSSPLSLLLYFITSLPRLSHSFNVFKYSLKSFPNSSFCNASSTVAFKNPNLSPAS